jgi:hypothetical protein
MDRTRWLGMLVLAMLLIGALAFVLLAGYRFPTY